jgi:hypothetical protein
MSWIIGCFLLELDASPGENTDNTDAYLAPTFFRRVDFFLLEIFYFMLILLLLGTRSNRMFWLLHVFLSFIFHALRHPIQELLCMRVA